MYTVCEYAREKYVLNVPLKANSEYQLLRSCRDLSEWYGRDPLLSEATDDMLSKWVKERSLKIAAFTMHRRRGAVITVKKHAAEAGMCDFPRRVRKVPLPQLDPEAWTRNEFQLLLGGAAALPGRLKNYVPRSVYFTALLWADYNTGLRKEDALNFDMRNVRDGSYFCQITKTSVWHSVQLYPETIAALEAIGGRYPLQWPQSPKMLYYWIKVACVTSNVPYAALQQMRRTGATHVHVAGGDAEKFLGHLTPGLARKHYICKRIAQKPVEPPPKPE